VFSCTLTNKLKSAPADLLKKEEEEGAPGDQGLRSRQEGKETTPDADLPPPPDSMTARSAGGQSHRLAPCPSEFESWTQLVSHWEIFSNLSTGTQLVSHWDFFFQIYQPVSSDVHGLQGEVTRSSLAKLVTS
jgi:hypothetical protein